MPKKLTLEDVELVARHTAPEWWDGLMLEERLELIDRFNEMRADEENLASTLQGKPRKRGTDFEARRHRPSLCADFVPASRIPQGDPAALRGWTPTPGRQTRPLDPASVASATSSAIWGPEGKGVSRPR